MQPDVEPGFEQHVVARSIQEDRRIISQQERTVLPLRFYELHFSISYERKVMRRKYSFAGDGMHRLHLGGRFRRRLLRAPRCYDSKNQGMNFHQI